jgi:uncharacterized membrane protein YfcA
MAGFYCLGHLSDSSVKSVVGACLLLLVILHFSTKLIVASSPVKDILPTAVNVDKSVDTTRNSYFILFIFGLLTGTLTVVANVAGPILTVYLLSIELPKRELNGTRAWLFLLANLLKLPAQILMGNMALSDFSLVSALVLIAVLFTLLAERYIVPIINQTLFELISWVLVAIGAIKLLLDSLYSS